MIKERRYETYGGKDGTIDMENKKSKRINFQRAADRTGAEHSFKDRQTE